MKNVLALSLLLVLLAMTVQAIPITIDKVEVGEVQLTENATARLDVERNEDLNVRIKITAQAALDNVEILGFISGFEYNDLPSERISDVTQVFQLDANVSYVRTLHIPLPEDIQVDDYKLRIVVSDRFGESTMANFDFKIDARRNDLRVEDVILIPGNRVRAGAALLGKVRIENKGQRDLRDVKVVMSVPALGVSATDYIDEIKNQDRQDETEEMLIRIPQCAKQGLYKLLVDIFYSDNRKKESTSVDIQVLGNELCQQDQKPTPSTPTGSVVAGTNLVSVAQGESTIVPFSITNGGNSQKGYTISFQAPATLTIKVSPSSTVIVGPGKTETLFVSITPVKDVTGPQSVTATVSSGTEAIESAEITVNVIKGKAKINRTLQGVLVALVAILVLVGLIMAFKRTGNGERTKPYY